LPCYRQIADSEKDLRSPIIWGPNYTSGFAVFGHIDRFEYSGELKNEALSSRPQYWDVTRVGFEHPTFSGRLGFRPNPIWNFGISASSGTYLLPMAGPTLPPGKDIGDYREFLLGQDISFEWHHWQIWAEVFETRFEVPRIGNADSLIVLCRSEVQDHSTIIQCRSLESAALQHDSRWRRRAHTLGS
jgi:hypothetical protein